MGELVFASGRGRIGLKEESVVGSQVGRGSFFRMAARAFEGWAGRGDRGMHIKGETTKQMGGKGMHFGDARGRKVITGLVEKSCCKKGSEFGLEISRKKTKG